MAANIYKYFPADVLDRIFSREGYCGLKCSLPKDYNDPFELFLGIDLSVGPEILATYREIIYELPQYPTTCFSRSPVVAPMWAHYAQNHSGFVVEFDVEGLKSAFPNIAIRDVNYREEPDEAIASSLMRAAVTKKPRHAVWLQQAVLFHAYFSKYTMWSYEQECRLVDDEGLSEDVSGIKVIFVPVDCIKSIIIGKEFPSDIVGRSRELADSNGIDWYGSHIGKSLPLPFLTDQEGRAFVFDGSELVEAASTCESCSEPFDGEGDLCPWCSITEEHEYEAARGNPFRILEGMGHLDDYLEGIRRIQEEARRR